MSRGGTDKNRFDFFNDGSGKGNCFEGNSSSQVRPRPRARHTRRRSCIRWSRAQRVAGTGTDQGTEPFLASVRLESSRTVISGLPARAEVPGSRTRIQRSGASPRSTPRTSGAAPDEPPAWTPRGRRLAAVAAGVMALGGVGAAQSPKPKVQGGELTTTTSRPCREDQQARQGQVEMDHGLHRQPQRGARPQAPGASRSRTFARRRRRADTLSPSGLRKPGKYHFVCTIHRSDADGREGPQAGVRLEGTLTPGLTGGPRQAAVPGFL